MHKNDPGLVAAVAEVLNAYRGDMVIVHRALRALFALVDERKEAKLSGAATTPKNDREDLVAVEEVFNAYGRDTKKIVAAFYALADERKKGELGEAGKACADPHALADELSKFEEAGKEASAAGEACATADTGQQLEQHGQLEQDHGPGVFNAASMWDRWDLWDCENDCELICDCAKNAQRPEQELSNVLPEPEQLQEHHGEHEQHHQDLQDNSQPRSESSASPVSTVSSSSASSPLSASSHFSKATPSSSPSSPCINREAVNSEKTTGFEFGKSEDGKNDYNQMDCADCGKKTTRHHCQYCTKYEEGTFQVKEAEEKSKKGIKLVTQYVGKVACRKHIHAVCKACAATHGPACKEKNAASSKKTCLKNACCYMCKAVKNAASSENTSKPGNKC